MNGARQKFTLLSVWKHLKSFCVHILIQPLNTDLYFSISIPRLSFSHQLYPCAPLPLRLNFQLAKGKEVKHDNEAFFYFCWPNKSKLLNTGWGERITQRSRQAGGCYEMEVTCPSLLCGTKPKRSIAHSPCLFPFFIISITAFCLSSLLPPS